MIDKNETATREKAVSELLPCPFCGGTAELDSVEDFGGENDGALFVQCKKCKATSALVFPCGDDPEVIVIEKWNARAAVSVWRPIESAPKDGTPILVYHEKGGVCEAFCPKDGFAWHCMDGTNTAPGKITGVQIPVMTTFLTPPTYWMPLPAPPATGGEG